jgi:PHD/YefM family antitoxin component YafN of YafNO toxin-antitoxin module
MRFARTFNLFSAGSRGPGVGSRRSETLRSPTPGTRHPIPAKKAPNRMDKRFDILDAPEDVRALVGECELTGSRTTFLRNDRPIAILISHDEYLALRETIDIADDAPLRAAIDEAEAEVERGAMVAVEDLLEIK